MIISSKMIHVIIIIHAAAILSNGKRSHKTNAMRGPVKVSVVPMNNINIVISNTPITKEATIDIMMKGAAVISTDNAPGINTISINTDIRTPTTPPIMSPATAPKGIDKMSNNMTVIQI